MRSAIGRGSVPAWLLWCVIISLAVSAGCSSGTRYVLVWKKSPPAFPGWSEWVNENVQDGDILFTVGQTPLLLGAVDYSKFLTNITAGRFCHVGLIAIEDGQAVVYHMEGAAKRAPLGEMLARHDLREAAIKRPSHVPVEIRHAAVEYCRKCIREERKMDFFFRPGDDRLYCTEMVELAYLESGVSLSDPVGLKDLPNYPKYAKRIELGRRVLGYKPDVKIYLPGNDDTGIWSNPELTLVLDLPDAKAKPSPVQLTNGTE